MPLTRHTLLERAPDLDIHITSGNCVRVRVADDTRQEVICLQHGLALLDAFARPISLEDALAELRQRVVGAQDWAGLSNSALQLYQAGILREAGRSPELCRSGYGGVGVHVRMLNDHIRTRQFLCAVREMVRPGDVVVDLGTGTGILAVAAAQAGARQVYAIEASSIANVAQAVFETNGVADRITLIRGYSTGIELPERADVFVSEMIGHEPLQEGILELTRDARARFLKPDSRFIPSRLRIFAVPVTVPREELADRILLPETLSNWTSWYSIDLTPFANATEQSARLFYVSSETVKRWIQLGPPTLLADLDLRSVSTFSVDTRANLSIDRDGEPNGVVLCFEAVLAPGIELSTLPENASSTNHWRCPVWALPHSPSLRAGGHIGVRYRYRAENNGAAVLSVETHQH